MKDVTAAIILYEGRVLIAQRAPNERLAGKWELPGGKLEIGETLEECLKREIREEFDADIEVINYFGQSIYEYENGSIRLIAYWCKWISGDFNLKVHNRIEWVDCKELDLYDYAPADVPLIEKIKLVIK